MNMIYTSSKEFALNIQYSKFQSMWTVNKNKELWEAKMNYLRHHRKLTMTKMITYPVTIIQFGKEVSGDCWIFGSLVWLLMKRQIDAYIVEMMLTSNNHSTMGLRFKA